MSDCTNFKSQLELFVLSPEASEFQHIASHVEDCPTCQSEVAAIREAWASIPSKLTPLEPSRNLRSQVMAAVDQSVDTSPKNEVRLPVNRSNFAFDLLKYAVAASVLVVLLYGYSKFEDRSTITPDTPQVAHDPVNDPVADTPLDEPPSELDSSKVHYVALLRVATRTPVATHVLCDLTSRQLHFVLFDLSDFETDSIYKIWLLGEQDQVLASSGLSINERKIGKALLALPPDVASVTQVIVTQEAHENGAVPSDEVLLGGQIDGKAWDESR